MHYHWSNIPSLLTPDECEKVIKHAQRHYKPRTAVVGHGASARHDEMRSSLVRWLSYTDLDLLWLRLRIEEQVLIANREGFGYNLQSGFTEIQFTEYHAEPPEVVAWRNRSRARRLLDAWRGKSPPVPHSASPGHYDWHEDNSAIMTKPMDRKLSFVLQLSNPADYDGGEFELRGDKLPDDAYKAQGDALLFRSRLAHRVKPVTRGVRYSLVTWIHGPRA